jgi:hypothetical protein
MTKHSCSVEEEWDGDQPCVQMTDNVLPASAVMELLLIGMFFPLSSHFNIAVE